MCTRVNRTKTGTKTYWTPVNTGKFYKTGLIGLRLDTCVNVASGEFRGSSYNTTFLSNKKCLVYLRPVPGEYFTKFLSSRSKIYDMHDPNTISV